MVYNIVKLPEMKHHFTNEETALVVNEVNEGNPFARTLFREAMVRTDMPISFTSISNYELIPQYKLITPQWQGFSRRVTLKDLRPQNFLEVWPDMTKLPKNENGRARIRNQAPQVGEGDEYPAIALSESSVAMRVQKYGLRLPLTLEMIINDNLDILAEYPQALAVFMRVLEDIVTAEALTQPDGSAPLSTLTHVTGNPALTLDALVAAQQQLLNVQVHGVYTNISDAVLVVPRNLYLKAMQITGVQVFTQYNAAQASATEAYNNIPNPAYGLKVVQFDVLTDVNISAQNTATWYLIANANATAGRPGLSTGFLSQYPDPQMFVSSPNALIPAGGLADWSEGSFLNDSIEFKVRHFTGAQVILNEGILVSTGAGS